MYLTSVLEIFCDTRICACELSEGQQNVRVPVHLLILTDDLGSGFFILKDSALKGSLGDVGAFISAGGL